MFDVPLWIEIHNMKSTEQVIRNINLVLYNHKKVIIQDCSIKPL